MSENFLKQTFGDLVLGLQVRRSIAKNTTYRVGKGFDEFGTANGKLFQYSYAYTVPTSIRNTESQFSRDLYRTAVENWQSVLSEDIKNEYRSNAVNMSGYNLYIKEFILNRGNL